MEQGQQEWRRGQSFTCEACGRDSIVRVRVKMEGWNKVGDVFACALCGQELGLVPAPTAPPGAASDALADRLASFLGEKREPVQRLEADGKTIFCRDCVHFLKHPFITRCLLRERAVDPMGDCERFEARPVAPGETDDAKEGQE